MANSQALLAFCGALLGLTILAPLQCYAAALSRRAMVAAKGDLVPSLAKQGGNDIMPSGALKSELAGLMKIPAGAKVRQRKFSALLPTRVVQDRDGSVITTGGKIEAGRLNAHKYSKSPDGGSSTYSSEQGYLSTTSYTHFTNPRLAHKGSQSSMQYLLNQHGVGHAELTGHGAPMAALPHSESGSRPAGRSEPIIEEVFDDEPESTVPPNHQTLNPQEHPRAPKIEEYHEPEPQATNVPSPQTVQQAGEKTKTSDNTAQQTLRTSSKPAAPNQAATYPKITEVDDEEEVIPLRRTQTSPSSGSNNANGLSQSAIQTNSAPHAENTRNTDRSLGLSAKTEKPLTKQSGSSDSHPETHPSPRQSREVTLGEFLIVIRRRFGAKRKTEILPFLEYLSKSRAETVERNTKFESVELAEAYVDWLNSNVVNNSFELMLKQGKEHTKNQIAGAMQKMTFEERAELMHPDLTAAQMKSFKKYMSSKDGLNNEKLDGEPWSDDVKELYEKWKQTPKPWTYHLAHIWQKMIQKLEGFNERVWLSFRGIWTQKPKIPTEIHAKAA